MKITKTLFGNYDGQEVFLFSVSNDNGLTVKIMNYGATVTDIVLPDKKSIACGFNTFEDYFSEEYRNNAPYFGCTVGRYCSQIKNSKFILNNKEYQLAANCGANNLHGGTTGFDKKMWEAKTIENTDSIQVIMSMTSQDMEEGFPGDVDVQVVFTLNNKNEISIEYSGTPTQDTPLSMTNHTYWNLSGFKNDIQGHKVTVLADELQECDDTGAATGKILSVNGTPDDLRKGGIVGEVQQKKESGFENFYLTGANFKMKKVAELIDPESNTKLEVSSEEPCMLFYNGIYTSDELKREEGGEQFGKNRGCCFETHRYQNGPNFEGSPKTITKVGEEFKSKTIFKLTW